MRGWQREVLDALFGLPTDFYVRPAGGKRTNWESSGGSRKTLNQLLTEMDGFEVRKGDAPCRMPVAVLRHLVKCWNSHHRHAGSGRLHLKVSVSACSSQQPGSGASRVVCSYGPGLRWPEFLAVQENSGVVVMGATNLPETLDSALTRPGRFDRQVRGTQLHP